MMLSELNEQAREKPLTWGALVAGIAGLIGALVPIAGGAIWLAAWIDSRYEARDPAADRPPIPLRQEMLGGFKDIRLEEGQKTKDITRQLAWNLSATLNNNVAGLRGRLNECDVRKNDKGGMSKLERDVCADYASQLRDAERKLANAQDDAARLSK